MHNVRLFPPGFREIVRRRRASYDPLFASGVWRYLELLPPIARNDIVSLGEGNMPLYESPSGALYLHLGINPTGSFADLGMTVAISAAKAAGALAVACNSAGIVARSMQVYAARAGLKALIASSGSLRADEAVYVDSGNPYLIEGHKCAAFAILEARSWQVPDWIVLSGDHSGMMRAIGKGLREAYALKLIDGLPRLTMAHRAHCIERDSDVVFVVNSTAQYGVDAFDDLLLANRDRAAIGA